MKPAPESERLSSTDAADIEAYLDAQWMERGLSENTLSAYRADLQNLARWLGQHDGETLLRASRNHLLEYLSLRVQQGARPRTTARLLSSIKRFYQYWVREKRLEADPSDRIDAPKLVRGLPKSLTESEVEDLLQAPEESDPVVGEGAAGREEPAGRPPSSPCPIPVPSALCASNPSRSNGRYRRRAGRGYWPTGCPHSRHPGSGRG